ncbi:MULTISPECIES: alginate lyase family protein [unclassified Duganella]|uniref:heparinase II/III family protein n=1 Tax=unclassified Duganella TaxID=2636909 RepID=UPI000E34BB4F|nr:MULTISPECIES: alginate lyase family protein [unclassified Duganella]RFP09621.1 heparinase [Duganella sp. BJB475]RFP27741.1 heparinase [Duganella sp. BJB476]
MTSLTWKINRLKLMGAPELVWRVQQLLQKKASTLGVGLARRVAAPSARFGAAFLPPDGGGADAPSLLAAADAILAGRWNVFALRGVELGFPPAWNRDPKTGTVAPMALGKTIDYRSEAVVGDIKYLWEPSRHLELVTLAQAWRLSGQQRYADGARALLQSWLDQCPYPNGVHWTSSLELAVRLLNWAFAWQLLGGAESALFAGAAGQRFQRQWLDSIYQHCHFIQGYFSRHSSANNHVFGEYMGLFVASLTWPCWPESARWQALARRGLELEAVKQNTADGVNREQAVYYQHEVMDMMLLCQLVGQANGAGFSAAYLGRLEKLAEFIAALLDAGGQVPMTGDADDAQMVRLAHQPQWSPYRSLLASCALLFQRPDFKAKAGAWDDKNAWLFGAAGRQRWDGLGEAGAEQPVMAFPEGGYYLLGRHFGSADEVRLVADCAPLGYLSIAAHGHADALAFTLSLGGEEFLIDPGTYAYHTQKSWRDYFRSTAAHNTVCVDHRDQSEIGGNFMWLRKANARLLAHQPSGPVQRFEGEHDGYQCLADPVTHRRLVEFDSKRNTVVVKDILQCRDAHHVALHWQLAEGCRTEISDGLVRVLGRRSELQLRCAFGAGAELLRGSETPIGGWISRKFDEKAAIDTLRWQGTVHGTTEIVTELRLLVNTTPDAARVGN